MIKLTTDKNDIVILILLLIIIYLISLNIFKKIEPPSYIDEYNLIIDNLEKSIDSLHNNNKLLNNKIILFENNVDSLKQILNKKNKEIIILKKEMNEKLNSIDSFTNFELQQFFTDRYRYNNN
jgi:peptidoglycan hydrolase CwlO-like protein